jgi:hypothetical protein
MTHAQRIMQMRQQSAIGIGARRASIAVAAIPVLQKRVACVLRRSPHGARRLHHTKLRDMGY